MSGFWDVTTEDMMLTGLCDGSVFINNPFESQYNFEFVTATKQFEKHLEDMTHNMCPVCRSVSLNLIVRNRQDGKRRCDKCQIRYTARKVNGQKEGVPYYLPIWHADGKPQYGVPEELSSLREGEKLLIQQIAPYVPLQHLQHGAYGSQGHVCSFPQQIEDVCTTLPRKKANAIKVIKHYKLSDGTPDSLVFMIRRKHVLDALRWLKKYNHLYADITIAEENMNWMEEKEECELDVEVLHETEEHGANNVNERNGNRDMTERAFGILPSASQCNLPSAKDNAVTNMINNAQKKIRKSVESVNFPYVSPHPVDEHDRSELLFAKAFPWLFPGGIGDVNDCHPDVANRLSLDEWIKKMLFYYDGRFARDKMWGFFVLNYRQRKLNQSQGAYFVKNFYTNGPQTLQQLCDEIQKGNNSWVNQITYFGNFVTGSAAYWRKQREHIYSWINYHVQQGSGAPTAFMTLSCAEYHWPDIKRLIHERYAMAGLETPDLGESSAKHINDYTIVIQEYFQQRVHAWFDTVGKQIFNIKHYWLRYEFAPGRGQIHAHALLIMDHKDLNRLVDKLDNEKLKASLIHDWAKNNYGMTAAIPQEYTRPDTNNVKSHPATQTFTEQTNLTEDAVNLCYTCQNHICTDYCLRKRRYL